MVRSTLCWIACAAAVVSACDSSVSPDDTASGVWGGIGLELTVLDGGGARLDYGCDAGTIDERLPVAGTFTVRGTHTFGTGGPVQQGAPRVAHAALYQGTIDGSRMRLQVSIPDLNRSLGEFAVEQGQRATLERCG